MNCLFIFLASEQVFLLCLAECLSTCLNSVKKILLSMLSHNCSESSKNQRLISLVFSGTSVQIIIPVLTNRPDPACLMIKPTRVHNADICGQRQLRKSVKLLLTSQMKPSSFLHSKPC